MTCGIGRLSWNKNASRPLLRQIFRIPNAMAIPNTVDRRAAVTAIRVESRSDCQNSPSPNSDR